MNTSPVRTTTHPYELAAFSPITGISSTRIFITKADRDAINAANAARFCNATYDGDLFADMFGA